LWPQAATAFAVRFASPTPSFARYQSQIVAAAPAHTARYHPGLSVRNVLVQDAGEAVMALSGEVLNAGPDAASQVRVLVTLLDEAGDVVGLRRTEASPQRLEPGQSAFFSVEIVPIRKPVADTRYQVEGVRERASDE
jgi:hypothetical protein